MSLPTTLWSGYPLAETISMVKDTLAKFRRKIWEVVRLPLSVTAKAKAFKLPRINIPHLPTFTFHVHLPKPKLSFPGLPKTPFSRGPKKLVRNVARHKILILVCLVLAAFTYGSIYLRNTMFSKTVAAAPTGITLPASSFSIPTPPEASLAAATPTPDNTAVLGTSSDTSTDYQVPTIPPEIVAPLPTITPAPTPMPYTPPAPSSSSSCAGTPNADNSQVYVSPSSTTTGSSSTITVDLQDCNNSQVSGDHLTITLASGDSGTTINGKSIGSGYNAQAQNGQYSFQVSSGNPTTAVFNIQDTDHNFAVTMPGYKQPTVTFTSTASTGNPNCTTGPGVPNPWYSDVYPPSSTAAGSNATFSVVIRDCFKNTASVTDSLNISLVSGDSGAQVNGSTPPISIQTQNGQASFTVMTQNTGTVTLKVYDTTSGFTVTDPNNNNPSATFTSNATPTPTPTPTGTPTPAPTTITLTPTPTVTVTPVSTSSATPVPS